MQKSFPLAVVTVLASWCPAGGQQIEAYPIHTSAEIAVGKDARRRAGRAPKAEMKVLSVVAPRNGITAGQILLKAKSAPATTRVTVSALRGPGGAVLPATAVRVRYGQYIDNEKSLSVYGWQKDIAVSADAAEPDAGKYDVTKGYWRVDALLPTARCQVRPNMPRCAWLTFEIPPAAAPGVYKAKAAIAGADADVPIELEVVDAVVPPLATSAMSNDIRPMWEVLAVGNGIALKDCWRSEAFWKMAEAYLAAMGRIRVNTCGIVVMAPSTTSSLGMVKWTRTGDKWSWDYTVMDRFIAAYRKAVGEPRVVEATAFSHDDQRCGLVILYTDAATGRQAVEVLRDGPAAAEVASAFVKDLRAHLATMGLAKKLAVGVWHDKMRHTGGTIRRRLLKDFPDLKLSLWAHSDGWGAPVKGRVASYMAKCHAGGRGQRGLEDARKFPYAIKTGMRSAHERSVAFGPFAWDAIARHFVGLGQVDLANWSEIRRAKEYTYYGAGMFTSYQKQLVYPMHKGQVVTGVLYELIREYAQDYELLSIMRARGVKTGFLADPAAAMATMTGIDSAGGRLDVRPATPAKVDAMHHAILRQAGAAKARPEAK